MLTKHNAIEIPADNPFANDKLERKVVADNLTRLVESTNQPFVISVEAPWGWGKTTFVNMWKTQLEVLGHTCLYFNAWENDFVEDPLIAFVGEISKVLVEKKAKGKVKTQIKKLQNIGGKIVRRSIPLAIQIATQGLLSQDAVKKASDVLFTSSDEIAGFASDLAEEKIKQYENDKNGILEFKKELSNLAKSLAEEENNKTPLVFFIDELDRCRPDFSVALLERIKHIFSVEGVVFVLGVDRNQLEQSVRSIYGLEMNTDGYLRRFIDFSFKLPSPSVEAYCQFMFEYFHLREAFQNHRAGQELMDIFVRTFIELAQSYAFSPRVIAQCFTEMNLIFRTTPPNVELHPELVAFLVSIKVHNQKLFSRLDSDLTFSDIQTIMSDIRSEIVSSERVTEWLLEGLEARLVRGYLKDDQLILAIQKITEISKTENHPDQKHEVAVLSNIQDGYFRRSGWAIKYLISRIKLLEAFS